MSRVMNGDIVCHPKGKGLAQIWPWNKKEVILRPVRNDLDLGNGAGHTITISTEEADKYEILRQIP